MFLNIKLEFKINFLLNTIQIYNAIYMIVLK